MICIYKINNCYSYGILIKDYDDYYNVLYWAPLSLATISLYETKEGALQEALRQYPINRDFIKQQDIIAAHGFCTNNKPKLLNDKLCGCFYCLKTFNPDEIERWVPDTTGTAICPYCGIDSVIGEHSGYPITKEFLEKMKQHWF